MKAEGLPGRRAHEIMVPIPDSGTKPYENTSRIKETRQSAVLILFSLRKPEAILYTLRNDNLPDHGGQISFPGGQQDEEESLLQTSCRELEEEVGIPPSHFRITGSITPLYVTPSRFIIHPWIAVCYDRPEITL